MWIFEMQYVIPYKGDCLRLTICMCYSRAVVLNIGLDASFDNMLDWKGAREKSGEVNVRNVTQQMMRLPTEFSVGVTLV
jgi:hypothetical protein